MSRRRGVIAAVWLAFVPGCYGTHLSGPFVQNVRLRGGELYLDKCPIEWSRDEVREATAGCTTERRLLPDALPAQAESPVPPRGPGGAP